MDLSFFVWLAMLAAVCERGLHFAGGTVTVHDDSVEMDLFPIAVLKNTVVLEVTHTA